MKCFTNIIQQPTTLLSEAIGHAHLLYFKGKHPLLLHTVTFQVIYKITVFLKRASEVGFKTGMWKV